MSDILMYYSPYCVYCIRARRLLANKGLDYQRINVVAEPVRRTEMIEKANGCKTVPQIFINSQHIGGFTELAKLESSGELDKLLMLNNGN